MMRRLTSVQKDAKIYLKNYLAVLLEKLCEIGEQYNMGRKIKGTEIEKDH